MDNRPGSDKYSVAIQHRPNREERPLPPYPGSSSAQHSDAQGDAGDAALYEGLVTGSQGAVNESTREYERWRESGYQESPSTYAGGNSEVNIVSGSSSPGLESRIRGSSASQRIGEKRSQANEAVNEMRANRPFRPDGPSGPRRTSSTSVTSSARSTMVHQGDGPSPGVDVSLLSHTPSQNRHRRAAAEGSEVIAPRWQPDAEVTFCPICGTQFSFFVRKHHCRKCGRVVCNSCSPHRITIPYQYIVQVPVEGAVMGSCVSIPRPSVDAARAGSSREVATLGGGERVRLCNPCVPDPNIAPPQPSFHDPAQPYSSPNRQGRSASAASSSYAQSQRQPNNLETFHEALRNTARVPREPSILSSTGIQYGSYNDQNYRNRTQEPWDARSRSSTISGTSRDSANMGNGRSATEPSQQQRQQRQQQQPTGNQAGMLLQSSAHANAATTPPPPQRAPAQHRIPEADLCWICHRRLPLSSVPNAEDLRAAHVNQCVINASLGTTGTPPPTQNAQNRPGPAANANAAPSADVFTAYRPSGLFHYTATEKDCVDDAECTICFEDYEVGQDMARLECFCRFHLKCIKEWWEKKHGQCPLHPN